MSSTSEFSSSMGAMAEKVRAGGLEAKQLPDILKLVNSTKRHSKRFSEERRSSSQLEFVILRRLDDSETIGKLNDGQLTDVRYVCKWEVSLPWIWHRGSGRIARDILKLVNAEMNEREKQHLAITYLDA